MKIFVNVKQAGKRKGYLTHQEIVLDPTPNSLRELITQIVGINVEAYNGHVGEERLLRYLLPEEMEDQAETGKIGLRDIRSFVHFCATSYSRVKRGSAISVMAPWSIPQDRSW